MSKTTMWWTDGHGNKVEREVNQTINVRDFIGTPGFSLLIVAANTHLSAADIERYLSIEERQGMANVGRSLSWIKRRRWLFQEPGTNNWKSGVADLDGQYARAVAIMREHPTESVRGLVKLLKERGISRSREWTRRHRCDEME